MLIDKPTTHGKLDKSMAEYTANCKTCRKKLFENFGNYESCSMVACCDVFTDITTCTDFCNICPSLRNIIKNVNQAIYHGAQGWNVPCDLHLEHLNQRCKEAVHGLQVNKTSESILRVGKSLGSLKDIIKQFDEDNGIPLSSGAHGAPNMEDRDLILQELLNSAVLSSGTARNHA